MLAGQNATCSFSAKRLSGQRSSTMRPITCSGTSSSGISLVASRWSNGNASASSSVNSCTANSHSGNAPESIASNRSRRWKSLSASCNLTASSQTGDCRPSFGRQWKLTKVDSPLALTSRKLWTPKPSIIRKRPRDGAVAHRPHHHMQGFRGQRDEIPERVVRARRLREAAVGFHLHGVDEVRELHRVLDDEHRQVVADQVEVAFLCVELDREATHIARRVHAARATGDGGEPAEHRDAAFLGQEFRGGESRQRLGQFEVPVRRGSAGVHDALRDALVVEVGDLLAKDEVFQQRRPTRPGAQRVLIVDDRDPLRSGQDAGLRACLLVGFATIAGGVPLRSGLACGGFFLRGHGVSCLGAIG